MAKASSVEDFKQISNFQSLRKSLLRRPSGQPIGKAVGVLGAAERSAIAFGFLGTHAGRVAGHSVRAPGRDAGNRSQKNRFDAEAVGTGGQRTGRQRWRRRNRSCRRIEVAVERTAARKAFDPATVSEAMWEQWRETVRRNMV